MRKLDLRSRFQADVRLARRRGIAIDWETLQQVFQEVISGHEVPAMLRPHCLRDEWAGFSEFHLEDDLLVVYRLTANWAEFHRLGRHQDLFRRR